MGGDSRLALRARVPVAEIARRLDLDRKTVRRCLRYSVWHHPYRRRARTDTLLAPHADYLRERAPKVHICVQQSPRRREAQVRIRTEVRPGKAAVQIR